MFERARPSKKIVLAASETASAGLAGSCATERRKDLASLRLTSNVIESWSTLCKDPR